MLLGIIAEDRSDVSVIKELTGRIIPRSLFSVKQFSGSGCGMLRRKCKAWAENLVRRGCEYLIIVHDLDSARQDALRQELQGKIREVRCRATIIIIPVREIEAWFLTDPEALKKVFGLSKQPKLPGDPEMINHPKERLRELIWQAGRKLYVNTVHNQRIAALVSLQELRKCRSFTPYPAFLRSLR